MLVFLTSGELRQTHDVSLWAVVHTGWGAKGLRTCRPIPAGSGRGGLVLELGESTSTVAQTTGSQSRK